MEFFIPKIKEKRTILALGAESAGNFSVYADGKIYFSHDFGDLLVDENFAVFKRTVLDYLKINKLKPDVILTDLHPLYKTTVWGENLAKKFKAEHMKVQHHLAHMFSSIGERIIDNCKFKIHNCYGIAMDGTGYGEDGKIWGGEVFHLHPTPYTLHANRIGHLENQVLIGGDLAVKEPARMLISILSKFLSKHEVFKFIKKYYSKEQFEVLHNQLKQNFNCLETSSTGRVLDAVSILLGFCGNKRNYKHEPIEMLEKNSTKPYVIKPIIRDNVLLTTPLFEYLIKNLDKDKKRLTATAQIYIASGLYEMVGRGQGEGDRVKEIYFAGGMANNKVISQYMESKGVYTNPVKYASRAVDTAFNRVNKKIYPIESSQSEFIGVPRGDAGLSFGQIFYFFSYKKRPLPV